MVEKTIVKYISVRLKHVHIIIYNMYDVGDKIKEHVKHTPIQSLPLLANMYPSAQAQVVVLLLLRRHK